MPHKILIVDDEKTILFAMENYFAVSGYEVHCACNKQQAETLLTDHVYAALITDLRLIGSNDTEGLDIAECARQQDPDACIILLTADDTSEVERSAIERGVDVCLYKPKPLGEIAQTVSELLHETVRTLCRA